MATRTWRPRISKSTQVIQDSRLLNLPAELRNLIYEFVARSSKAISVREKTILYCPALSLVCRQIRSEYRKIYLDEAVRNASRVNIHLTDFVTSTSKGGDVFNTLKVLSNPTILKSSGTIRIFMTNVWDRHRLELRNFIEHGNNWTTMYDLEIVWDPKTFDVEFLRETMQKLRFCHARDTRLPNSIWFKVEKALMEAFERYAPPAKSSRVKGKRRRKTIEAEEAPKKAQRRR